MHAGDEDTKKKPRETQSLRRKEDLLEEQNNSVRRISQNTKFKLIKSLKKSSQAHIHSFQARNEKR